MGSRGKDPFDFNDIYKQAGVDSLFVKKSMADMKKPAAPAPVVRESPRPQPPSDNIPAAYGSSAPARTAAPVANSATVPTSKSPSDPFASLNIVQSSNQPMASKRLGQDAPQSTSVTVSAASSPRVPPAASHTPAVSGFDLDDYFGVGAAAAPKAAAPVAASSDPFAAFGGIEGALPVSQHPAPKQQPAATSRTNIDTSSNNYGPAAPRPSPRQATPPTPSTHPSPRPSSQPPSYTDSPPPRYEPAAQPPRYEPASQPPHYDQPPRPQSQPPPAPRRSSRYSDPDSQPATTGGSYHSQSYEAEEARPPSFNEVHMRRTSSEDVLGASRTASSGRSGFKGLLKSGAALGKKALRVAKEGLHSMESYLEKLEETNRPDAHSGPHFSDEEIMALAVRVSELPSNKQEDALAALPRDVRLHIAHLIRQQAMAEVDASSASFGAPPTHAAASRPRAELPRAQSKGDIIATSAFNLDSDDDEYGRSSAAPARAPAVRVDIKPASPMPSPRQQRAPPAPAPVEDDLLGISSTPAPPPAASGPLPSPPSRPAPTTVHVDDLLGLGGGSKPAAAAVATSALPPRPQPPPAVAVVHDPAEVDDFFSGGSSSTPSSAQPSPRPAAPTPAPAARAPVARAPVARASAPAAGHIDDFFSGGAAAAPAAPRPSFPKPSSASALDALAGLARGAVAAEDSGPVDPNEPEHRRILREQRLAEREQRAKAALEESQMKEQAEADRREEQVQLKGELGAPVQAWKNKHKGNIRGLIGSLQTVLWEDSGWKVVGMGDLLEPNQVRKAWMKANLIVHPDKVKQKNGTPEQLALADMIFDVLKEAMGQFR